MLFALALAYAGASTMWPRRMLFDYFSGNVLWSGDGRANRVALTFDDGPDPRYTPPILDILKRHRSKATFFLMGENVALHPDLSRRIVEEGHLVGNHTYSHPRLIFLNRRRMEEEIDRAENLIAEATGVRPVYFRPPYGLRDFRVLDIVQKKGYTCAMWTTMSWDWWRPDVERIISASLKKLKAGGILLLHDGNGDRWQTVQALERIVIGLKERGLELVTLSELTQDEGLG